MNKFPSLLCLAVASLAFSSEGAEAQPSSKSVILSEDFESTAAGAIPAGFIKSGAVAVSEDAAHSGHHSLRMEPGTKGARTITLKGDQLAALGGEFWGRLYFKIKLPSPLPLLPEGKTSASIHTTMVSGKAKSPLANDPIEVRMLGTLTDMTGAFAYLYNVQPTGGRKEFGAHGKPRFHYSEEWTLAEWHVDQATQSYELFINGEEITEAAVHKGAGKFEGAEIPALFESLTFGWTNYQAASGEGFTAWIDDLALSKERLGPVPAGSPAPGK